MIFQTYGTAACRHCGEDFTLMTTEQVYCSDKCRWNWWYREKLRRNPRQATRPPWRTCEACDEWFRPWRRDARCCSTHCGRMMQWARKARICECVQCGRSMLTSRNRKYCGRRCTDLAKQERVGRTDGFVYFIQGEHGGPIKIGFAADPEKRLGQIQAGNPDRLLLLGTRPGGARLEAQLHRRFDRHRIRHEWFAPAVEVLAYIDDRPQLRLVA